MKSLGAVVRTSKPSPPAAAMPALTRAATASRWLKQIARPDEEFTIAIFGLSMSSSDRPSARHCALRVAQRTVPGSKLLRSPDISAVQVGGQAGAEFRVVDLVHAVLAGQVERVRRGRAHRTARSHHADA